MLNSKYKKMKRISLNVLLMGMLLVITIPIYAQQDFSDRGKQELMRPHGKRGGVLKIPDLTDEQASQIKEMRLANFKKIQPIENEINEKRARLNTMLDQEQVDRKAVEKMIGNIGELRTELAVVKEFHRLDVRAILTEEQKMFMSKMKDRKQKHKIKRR